MAGRDVGVAPPQSAARVPTTGVRPLWATRRALHLEGTRHLRDVVVDGRARLHGVARARTLSLMDQAVAGMAKQMRDTPKRGDALGLTEDELAFYDALVDQGNVKEIMGDVVLAAIAHDLVEAIRASVTIDWIQKEAVRADMRRKVKRLLKTHGYTPDKQEGAVKTVIAQAERVCRDWAGAA